MKNQENGAILIVSRPKKVASPARSTAVIALAKGKARAAKTIHQVVGLGFRSDLEEVIYFSLKFVIY